MNGRAEIQSLTGLRGVAALLIVWCHWGTWMRPTGSPTLPPMLAAIFGTDEIAMTMFFVLSGFVIAYNYGQLDWRGKTCHSLINFFTYRIARLYPLYLVFILYTVWMRPNVFSSGNYNTALWHQLITTVLGIQSWLPFVNSHGELAMDNEFNISWSISTEFFLYITFTIMMLVCRSFRLRFIVTYFVISGLLFAVLSSQFAFSLSHLPEATYSKWLYDISPFRRMFEFGAGMLACWVVTNIKNEHIPDYISAFGFLLLFIVWLNRVIEISLPRNHINIFIVAAFLIVAGSTSKNRINSFLSHSALVYTGIISYSIYLFHNLPTILIGGQHMIQTNKSFIAMLGAAIQIYLFNFALGLIILFALATGLYRGVEMPARRFVRTFIQR